MSADSIKTELDTLEYNLLEAPRNIRLFSLSLRSLFAENAVGTPTDTAVRFRKLRDDTRNDAVVYVKGVLPIVKQCVSDIKGYFEYYTDLTIEEWWESLTDIIEEAKINKEACEALIVIHEDMMTELKKRQDSAKTLISEMKDLSEKLDKEVKELRQTAEAKQSWAFGLLFIPFVNVIASPILGASADTDLVEAVGKQKEAEIQISAAKVANEVLVPALSKFIDGLRQIAGFFSVLHQELETFQSKGEKARQEDKPKRIHYNVMKGKANRVMGECNQFFAVLPSVRTDLEAIPTEGTDQNYVDKWMQNQKAIIKDKCSNTSMVGKLLKAITSS